MATPSVTAAEKAPSNDSSDQARMVHTSPVRHRQDIPHMEQTSPSHVSYPDGDQGGEDSSEDENDIKELPRRSRQSHRTSPDRHTTHTAAPHTFTHYARDTQDGDMYSANEVKGEDIRSSSPIQVPTGHTIPPRPAPPSPPRQQPQIVSKTPNRSVSSQSPPRSRSPVRRPQHTPQRTHQPYHPQVHTQSNASMTSSTTTATSTATTATTGRRKGQGGNRGDEVPWPLPQHQPQVLLPNQKSENATLATSDPPHPSSHTSKTTIGQHYQQQRQQRQQQAAASRSTASIRSHRKDLSPPPSPPPTPPPLPRGEDRQTHHGNKDRDLLRVLAAGEERGGGSRNVTGQATSTPLRTVESGQASPPHTRVSRDQFGIEYNSGADDMAIRVVVRKRPLSGTEMSKGDRDVLEIRSAGQVLVHEPKTKVDLTKVVETQEFFFDDAFEETTCNEQIYGRVIWPLVRTAMQGGKASCFAYGQTGSGMAIIENIND